MNIRSTKSVKFGDIFTVVGGDSFSEKIRGMEFNPHDLKDGDVLFYEDMCIYIYSEYADVIQEIYEFGECSFFIRDDTDEEVWEYPTIRRRYYRSK